MPFTTHPSRSRTKSFQERSKSFDKESAVVVADEFALDRGVEHPLSETVREIGTIATLWQSFSVVMTTDVGKLRVSRIIVFMSERVNL